MSMRMKGGAERFVSLALITGAVVLLGIHGCGLFESERVSKGRSLYGHYCMHCHGESGRQNEGFNWMRMPDPRPKDLSNESEMSTFQDEEIFHTIYRDMKDTTPDIGDEIGDDEFGVPTMPSFKFTLSQDEIWSLVAYVRTLHGMSLTFDVDGRLQELKESAQAAEAKLEEATKALEAAEARMEEEAENEGEEEDEDDEVILPEEEAAEEAEIEYAEAEQALQGFVKRSIRSLAPRPAWSITGAKQAELASLGERLYENKYGCNGCHSIGDQGGIVGPPLDRAGFRLNEAWIYRWIKYPQGFKRKTRMPNLGVSDEDAMALTIYLKTLRAPKPEKQPPA